MHIYRPFLYTSRITRKGVACDKLCGVSRYYTIPYLRSDCLQYFSLNFIVFKNFNISSAYYSLDLNLFSKLTRTTHLLIITYTLSLISQIIKVLSKETEEMFVKKWTDYTYSNLPWNKIVFYLVQKTEVVIVNP